MKPSASNNNNRIHEQKLIVQLCKVSNLNQEAVQESLRLDLDWEYIYHTASLLGAAPLLYYHLRKLRPPALMASPFMDALKELYHLTLANNLYLIHEFDAIAEKLSAASIPCIGLKGIALAGSIYPSPALRPMLDLDMLTQPEDLQGVHETLTTLGYHAADHKPLRKIQNYYYHMHYMKETSIPVILEVHWGLGEKNRYGLDEKQIWERAGQSAHGPYLVLSEDDTLLYLALHFFKHFLFKRLSWLCDIHEWITHKELHWEQIIQRARSQSIATFLAYTLLIFENFYGMKLPVDTVKIIKIGPVRKQTLDWYLRTFDMFHPLKNNNWILKRLFAFTAIDRFSNRLKFTMDALKRDAG